MLTLASAFSGIGGFELGLRGIAEPVWACDIDPAANAVYKANFAHEPRTSLYSMPKGIDLFTAGFPCTPYSMAGKMNQEQHDKGLLYKDVINLILMKKPRYWILENVEQFQHTDAFKEMSNVLPIFQAVISGVSVGVPQRRKRLFMTNFFFKEPELPKKDPPMKGVLNSPEGRIYHNLEDCEYGHLKGKHKQGFRIYSDAYPAPTISRRMRLLVTNGKEVFTPSVREYYNLFGFPEDFIIDERKSYALNQIGNSLIPQIIRHIGLQVPKV